MANNITYKAKIKSSMERLGALDNSIFIGYGLGESTNKGAGFLSNVPLNKIIETPVSENLMLSMAIGLSLEGYLPVVVFERFDFIMNAMDALVNHLGKMEEISCGEFEPKVIIRCIVGGKHFPFFTGATHTQDFSLGLSHLLAPDPVEVYKLSRCSLIEPIYTEAIKNTSSSIIVEYKDLYDTNS